MIVRHLVIMVKEPRPGRVKTRLARDIGTVAATNWFRHQTARLLRRVGADRRWTCWLAVSPDTARTSRAWPPGVARVPQGRGDLGARMARAMRDLPPGPALIVGADIPGIEARHIAAGFEALCGSDAVFGPAPDGGYWMIGLRRQRRLPSTFLSGVRWSSRHALTDSAATLPADFRVGTISTLQDVDTGADLAAVRRQRG